MLTSEQVLEAISDLDSQAEEGYQSYVRERNEALMISHMEKINQLRYQYPDSPCEYNEPRNKSWGQWMPVFLLIGSLAGMFAYIRWGML